MSDYAGIIRQAAPDRYFSALYASADARSDLFALYAFDAEIAGIRSKVSTAMLGEVRLQWWRDALANGQPQGNPLATDIISLMGRRQLPIQALLDLLDARIFDLYDDPFPTANDLEGYAGETRGRILSLASAILAPDLPQTGPAADAAGHGGVALLLRDALFDFDANAATGQVFLPGDLSARLSEEATSDAGFDAVAGELRERALAHIGAFLLAAEAIPAAARPAFMPVALAQLDLTHGGGNARTHAPLWRRLWALRKIAKRGFAP